MQLVRRTATVAPNGISFPARSLTSRSRRTGFTVAIAIATVSLLLVSSLTALGIAAAQPAPPNESADPQLLTAAAASTQRPAYSGPHPGTLEIWEASSGGPETLDPSVCYFTVCEEPIDNVYETLIAYNGSADGPSPASYEPELATCVPGSAECAAQFGGNDLVFANATTGAPQYYTFELDAGARFYDPATTVDWAVYPSDVVFTFARTLGWADLEYEEQTNGWINGQALLPPGNAAWDAGIHSPLNNTPEHILDSFLVNDSAYCPSSATIATNGCVTFDVGASGAAWPFFLELIASNLGASIEPCGWFTAQGAGVPGFLGTNASNGDGPCLLPGNSTSTGQSGFRSYLQNVGPTGWDSFEMEANNWPATQPGVQWSEVGSGPYYLDGRVQPAYGYTLAANPDYAAPVGCTDPPPGFNGSSGCLPVAGSYIPNVDVVWESGTVGDQTGLNEVASGQADSVGFYPADTPTFLNNSVYSLISGIPSLEIGFFPLNLDFNVTDEQSWDTTGQLNVPGDFFQNVALRQFLVHAYPYETIDSTYDSYDGVAYAEPYGGVIPHNMSGDPSNISWPSGDPSSNSSVVGNLSWWWDQANNATGEFYDPQLAACTAADPCRWAEFSFQGATVLDDEYNDWNGEIENLTNGTLEPYYVDAGTECGLCGVPGENSEPVYDFGWAPDYPDPSDYTTPMLSPNNSYTGPDAVAQSLGLAPNNASTCPDNYGAWSNLTYWANRGEIPTACQGAAYDTMVAFMDRALSNANIAQRAVEYNLVEHIANELALYVYDPQNLVAVDFADWIAASSVNTNPMIGGEGMQLWFDWAYNTSYPHYAVSFVETGLTVGTDWQVTLGGTTNHSLNSTVTFQRLANGTYPYTVGLLSGVVASPISGNVTIAGASATVPISFTPVPTWSLIFSETGLPNRTAWTMYVGTNSGTSTTSSLAFPEPNGTYNYTVQALAGYSSSPTAGQVTIQGTDATISIAFSVNSSSYPVTILETGLPNGTLWSANLSGVVVQSTTDEIGFLEPNGTYLLHVGEVANYSANYSSQLVVRGGETSADVAFASSTYAVPFEESGLPSGSSWTVSARNVVTGASTTGGSTGTSVTLHLPDGDYTMAAKGPAGFVAALTVSQLAVAGANVGPITVTFVPSTSGGGTSIGTLELGIAAVAGVAIVLLAVLGATISVARYRASQWRTEAKGWVDQFHRNREEPIEDPPPPGLR
jgi:hypothetical protein